MKRVKNGLLACLYTVGVVACGGANNEKVHDDYIGVWQADGYNYALHIGVSKSNANQNKQYSLKQYSYTQDHCLLQRELAGYSLSELQQIVKLGQGQVVFEFIEPGQSLSPGIRYTKQETLPAACRHNLSAVAHQKNYRFDAERDFDIFWQTFNELYVSFDEANIDWQEIELEFRSRLQLVQNENDLAVHFAQMIERIQDGHNIVVKTELTADFDASMRANLASGEVDVYSYPLKPTYADLLIEEYVQANNIALPLSNTDKQNAYAYAETQLDLYYANIFNLATTEVHARSNDHFIWTTLENNIGYILINQMDGYTSEFLDLAADKSAAQTQIDEAVAELQDTQAIIIDVRLNEGGFDEVGLVYISRFLSEYTALYSKHAAPIQKKEPRLDVWLRPDGEIQYLKPVVVLTSATTFSGAEVFALAMRERANTTLVGERSGGGFSDILLKRVSSNIAFGLSNEVYTSPRDEWFERLGVPVNHEVSMPTKAQRESGIDPILQRALELF